MQRFFFFFFCLHLGYFTCAQGPELLIQQYDQGPDLEYYRKWNFDVFIQPHLTNTADLNTKGRIQLDVGGNVHYRFDKNFGLSSGIHYQRISYAYALANDTSIDRLRFLRFPLVLSVYPVKRVQLSLGGSYHLALKASGQPLEPQNEVSIRRKPLSTAWAWLRRHVIACGENFQPHFRTVFKNGTTTPYSAKHKILVDLRWGFITPF